MVSYLNHLGKKKIPFLFLIDFECKNYFVCPIDEIDKEELLYDLNGISNSKEEKYQHKEIEFQKFPITFEEYKKAFDYVLKNLEEGYSYLVNLTFPTEIKINLTLKEIFHRSQAKYKLWFKDKFIFFSPETFVQINEGKISSYPMKGTIDANVPYAKKMILENEKEHAEHVTIVDLIRNDLSMVAKNVKVERFRYIDEISTNQKTLLQVSSKTTGVLPQNYNEKIGDIISTLLPAGSISGAPKKKTLEIIKNAENYERGFYTGVCGYFDGKNLDSCVMIRFIEKLDDKLFYKSGGGITIYSDVNSEYQELLDKVYVPFN